MAASRSNSSQQLRQQLTASYCQVNDVLNSLKIERYFAIAQELYQQAAQCYQKALTGDSNELDRAYIFLRRFVTLIVDKLPSHQSWNLPQHRKQVLWARQAGQNMLTLLEETVALMDAREDAKRTVVSIDDQLLDEFDGDGTSAETTSPASSSGKPPTAAAAVAPPPLRDIFSALRLPEPPVPAIPVAEAIPVYPGGPETDALELMETDLRGSGGDARFAGVTTMDLEILRRIVGSLSRFAIPQPMQGDYEFSLSWMRSYQFDRDDFHVSFTPYLITLPIDLQMARPAVETNRCFFIHLGIAMNIHPFCLEVALRNAAQRYLMTASSDDIATSVLPSLLEYAGFVDANSLSFIWPVEFNTSRICFISGDSKKPMFTCFVPEGQDPSRLRDVIIHCDGTHFTLLRPKNASNTAFEILNQLIADAKRSKCVVHEHVVRASFSVNETLRALQL